jgi:hypothetical protein
MTVPLYRSSLSVCVLADWKCYILYRKLPDAGWVSRPVIIPYSYRDMSLVASSISRPLIPASARDEGGEWLALGTPDLLSSLSLSLSLENVQLNPGLCTLLSSAGFRALLNVEGFGNFSLMSSF